MKRATKHPPITDTSTDTPLLAAGVGDDDTGGVGGRRLMVLGVATVVAAVVIFARARQTGAGRHTMHDEAYSLAVCYSGQVRALRRVYEQNMAAFRGFDPDVGVFVYLNLRDSRPLPSGTAYVHNHTREELMPALRAMGAQPKFYNASKIVVPPRVGCRARLDADVARYGHHYRDFYAARMCYRRILQAERARGERFAWVMRLRPGVYVDVRRPPLAASRQIHMAGYDIALVPRPLADTFFDAVDAYEPQNCQQLGHAREDACGYAYVRDSNDCLAVRWLKYHGLETTSSVYVNRRIVVEE